MDISDSVIGGDATAYGIDVYGTSLDGQAYGCELTVKIRSSIPESWFDNHFRPQLVFYIRQMIAQHPYQWLTQNTEAATELMQAIASELMETVTRPQ